ncbi:MAG: type IX secretion system membrane protein PorP/SprF [Ferruginibacter sp.]|nr:type IX secretion system membrane protein PorP/SprF [Ferruginibacter sp.]
MKKSIKACFIILLAIGSQTAVKAQVDPHFTQYYISPSWLNPALTGVFDGDYRVSAIYRTQWGNISSPYSTPGVAVDFSTSKNANFGLSVLNQAAGDGGYNYTTAYGNMAYTGLRFGANGNQRITIGMQVGMIQRRFNSSKLTFGDQWNPISGYNPGNATADLFSANSTTSFDMGAGALYYDGRPGKKANFFAGFSLSHLTKPKDDFSGKSNAVIPMRFTGHAGLRIKLTETVSITPNFLYLDQGTASEKMLGAYGEFKLGPVNDFMIGANYRVKDAISPFAGFTHKGMVIGLSYDINTSDLGKLANGSNSFELSLSFIGRKTAKTPEAEFVCPRL